MRSLGSVFFLFSFFLFSPCLSYVAHAHSIEVFSTGNSSELVETLKVTGYKPNNTIPYKKTVIYCQKLEDIAAGDTMQVQAKMEVTSEYGFNTLFASYLALSINCTVDGSVAELSEAGGSNIVKGMHHAITSAAASYQFKKDFDKVYVIFIAYTSSTRAKGNCAVKVEKDYGNINGLLFRAHRPH